MWSPKKNFCANLYVCVCVKVGVISDFFGVPFLPVHHAARVTQGFRHCSWQEVWQQIRSWWSGLGHRWTLERPSRCWCRALWPLTHRRLASGHDSWPFVRPTGTKRPLDGALNCFKLAYSCCVCVCVRVSLFVYLIHQTEKRPFSASDQRRVASPTEGGNASAVTPTMRGSTVTAAADSRGLHV